MTEAIHEMSRKMMGITAVVDAEGRLRGVISDGDLRRLLESDPGKLESAAGACGRPNPRTIDGDEFAAAALESMRSNRITSLFVLDANGRLEGAIHMHDLLERGMGA
jgi:arabinose-5-phosphate isomerase